MQEIYNLGDMTEGAIKFMLLLAIANNMDDHYSAIEQAKKQLVNEFTEKFGKFASSEMDAVNQTEDYLNDCIDLIKINDNLDLLLKKIITENK